MLRDPGLSPAHLARPTTSQAASGVGEEQQGHRQSPALPGGPAPTPSCPPQLSSSGAEALSCPQLASTSWQ